MQRGGLPGAGGHGHNLVVIPAARPREARWPRDSLPDPRRLSMSPKGTPSGSNQARTLPTLDAEQLGDFALAPAGTGLVVDRRSRGRGVPQVALPHIERHPGLGARSAESVPERMGMQMDCLGA